MASHKSKHTEINYQFLLVRFPILLVRLYLAHIDVHRLFVKILSQNFVGLEGNRKISLEDFRRVPKVPRLNWPELISATVHTGDALITRARPKNKHAWRADWHFLGNKHRGLFYDPRMP